MKAPSWIDIDAVAPPEIRDECKAMLDRINAIVPELDAIARDASAALSKANASQAQVVAELEPVGNMDASDGMNALVAVLNGSDELYMTMLRVSDLIHPERVVEPASADDDTVYLDGVPQVDVVPTD